MYNVTLEDMTEKVILMAMYDEDEYGISTAVGIALNDVQYWYNDDKEKQTALENAVYAYFNLKSKTETNC